VLHQDDESLSKGYRGFYLPLFNSVVLELRQVIDEELYVKFSPLKGWKPFFYSAAENPQFSLPAEGHPNSVTSWRGVLESNDTEPGELRDFLAIRKEFPLWAIDLSCQSVESFKTLARPEFHFLYRNQNVDLIHLGPNCYDLVISDVR